jgi:nucleoside 2-deoxyribosyltransferase
VSEAVLWIKPLSLRCLLESGENGAVTTTLRRSPKPGDIGLRIERNDMNRTIYLCGPINGRTTEDATSWRETVKQRWNGGCLDPMRRDYRGRELEPGIAAEIVAGDIEDIQAADAILVFFDKPSVGTSMEVFYAKHVLGKPVVVIDASDKPLSPWLIHHSDLQTKHVSVALSTLNMIFNRRDEA